MEALEGLLNALTAIWAAFYDLLDSFTDAGLLISSLVTLLIGSVIFGAIANVIVRLLMMLIIGGGVFFSLLSIDGMPEGIALLVAIIVTMVAGASTWRGADSKRAKVGAGVAEVLLGFALLFVIATVIPNVEFGNELEGALQRTGEFASRLFDSSQEGAELLDEP